MDLYLDLKVMVNTLPESKRSHLANKEVQNLVATIDKGTGSGCGGHGDGGSCIVWLMGHSLGASLALDVGRGHDGGERLQSPDLPLQSATGVAGTGDRRASPDEESEEVHTCSQLLPEGKNGQGPEAPQGAHGEAIRATVAVGTGAVRA